jgi:Ala-tRNA(Pro) deacylase
VILDERLMAHAHVNFHPLTNTRTTRLASADLLRFLKSTGHAPRIMRLDRSAGEPA